MAAIIRNAIRCNHCQVEIESKYRHDFVWHTCAGIRLAEGGLDPGIAVDGGKDYLKRSGDKSHWTDIST